MLPAIRDLDWQLVGLIVFLGVLGGAVAFLLWTAALTPRSGPVRRGRPALGRLRGPTLGRLRGPAS